MRIQLKDGTLIGVLVKHEQGLVIENQREYRGRTSCYIECGNDSDNVIGFGEGLCALTDNFCKHKGAVVAIARAMDMARLDKDDRTNIWKKFFNNKYGASAKPSKTGE